MAMFNSKLSVYRRVIDVEKPWFPLWKMINVWGVHIELFTGDLFFGGMPQKLEHKQGLDKQNGSFIPIGSVCMPQKW